MFSINMKQNNIITNLRMERTDWLQIKAMAGEMGVSANEYINYLIKDYAIKKELAVKKIDYKKLPIWKLAGITASQAGKGMDISSEDKDIYGK